MGKPSTGHGAIDCNATYGSNIGVTPLALDLAEVTPAWLADALRSSLSGFTPTVLIACPPCTGFSRTVAHNHLRDDPRNSLVAKVGAFARALAPDVVVMENARELLTGRFRHHFEALRDDLAAQGYEVSAAVHMLNRFGLPQQRERAVVLAFRAGIRPRSLDDLWSGLQVNEKATHVRHAIWDLPPLVSGATDPNDPVHTVTLSEGDTLDRLRAVPRNGGSWVDLLKDEQTRRLLTPAMLRSEAAGTLNHHCDAYGRMAWDRPAPTIKRECTHTGNGRYAHPEQDRLCSVREMAILQGFPSDYTFLARSRKNAYRSVGDAVPPLVSFQLAHAVHWALTGRRPEPTEMVLPGTSLRREDLEPWAFG